MSRRALLISSTAGAQAPQYHPVTTVGDVRLQQHQTAGAGWHSPVPYLFGGLAAMLGLIAFALLILACSYWKLSAFPESSSSSEGEPGGEKAGGKAGNSAEEGREMSNVVVIMAGQLKPTFIATPSTSRSSSFGDSVNGDRGTSATSSTSSDSSSEDDQVRRGSTDHDDALPHHHHELHPNPAEGDLPV